MRTKLFFLLAFVALLASESRGQNVGINATGAAPAASAMLDLTSATTGLLIPRIALTATNVAAPVVAPAVSLLVYNTATAGAAPNNVTPGFYYWNGAAWVQFATGVTGWTTIGNYGTSPAANWIGTNDANDWVIKTGGTAATNERARLLTAGQMVVNNTGIGLNTNDVFSVYGTGTTNGVTGNTSALGLRAINGYTSAGGASASWGVLGSATGTTGNTFGMVGLATTTTGTANAIRGEAASVSGPAIVGISNTSGGAVPTATATIAISGQLNGTVAGTGVGIGVRGIINPTVATGDARGVYGLSSSNNGTGVWGQANTALNTGFPIGTIGQVLSESGYGVLGFNTAAGAVFNPVGTAGQVSSAIGFGVDGYNLNTLGTGVLGEGNNLVGIYLGGGGGGAFSGATNGSFSYAFTPANGTGVIGVGNGSGVINTLATGGGGAFTGAGNGVYGNATTAATGTGVIGVGNNALPGAVLAGGSGGAFKGATAGSYGLATTVANGTGVIGVGNNAGVTTLAGGSGGAFTGTTTGSLGLATTAASGTGVIGVGNNGAANVLAGGSGGAFSGTATGAYGLATTAASGTGVIGVGNNAVPAGVLAGGSGGAFTGTGAGAYGRATNAASGTGVVGAGNNAAPILLLSGSGMAGTGDLFGVYGVANSNAAGAAAAPARAGGYFESGTPVDAFTYVACLEGAGVPRKVMGNGTVNTVVKNDRDEYVLLSAPEAPENLFQDYGTGHLLNGRTHVQLDPTLTRNILVNEEHPLRVFVQLRGDCHGVYVTNETAEGFDVVELQGGSSNTAFYWTVTANRANQVRSDGSVWHFAEERFAHTMGPQLTQQAPTLPSSAEQVVLPVQHQEAIAIGTETQSALRTKGRRPDVAGRTAADEPAPVMGTEHPQ